MSIEFKKAVFNAFAKPTDEYSDYLFSFNEVIRAIKNGESFKTNFMSEMTSCWGENNGYHVFIVDSYGNEHEISNETDLTPKFIRPAHNIYKMWRSGSFCNPTLGRNFRYD